jgi:hypothetical protein
LEVAEVTLPPGHVLRVPTADETLRIKGYLVVRRNQVRDYIDVAALSDRCGIVHAADARTIEQLRHYKDLDVRWADWGNVTAVCRAVAVEMVA